MRRNLLESGFMRWNFSESGFMRWNFPEEWIHEVEFSSS